LSDWVTNTEAISRFKTEALVSLKLNHPNIINVRDIDQEKGTYFLVMEYLNGQDLRDILTNKGRLELDEAEGIFVDVCDALDYAHCSAYKLIHRDLKPQNVFVCDDGTSKVMDFGIAKILDKETMDQISSLTRSGQSLGTLEYMAPEQRKGLDTMDARADIYSLGLILYEMLTGELPVGAYEKPSEISGLEVPDAIDTVIDQCMAQRVEKRFTSVVEMKNAFLTAIGKQNTIESSINYQDLYLQACERVYLDNLVEPDERAMLNGLKGLYNLSDDEADEIEQMVRVKYPDVVELELAQEPNKTLEIHKSKIIDGNTLVERGGVEYKINSEEPFNGEAEWHFENGQKQKAVVYKDGKRTGLFTKWHENGQKLSEIPFKDGKEHGLYTTWYENGQIKEKGSYNSGRITSGEYWDANGKKIDYPEKKVQCISCSALIMTYTAKKTGGKCMPCVNNKEDGACYIATMVYGSYNAPEVKVLRKFRDEVLLKTRLGSIFVKIYYWISPKFVEKTKSLKSVHFYFKRLLNLIVKFLKE
jgi:serine/threonine protein kinase